MADLRRKKMCEDKATFFNPKQAAKMADKFGQTVYECPVCFCWHLTSLSDWRLEFVEAKKYENLLREHKRILACLEKCKEENKKLKELK